MAQKLSTISSITANDRQYKVFSLNPLAKQYDLKKLPY
jgi:hypothetical protein